MKRLSLGLATLAALWSLSATPARASSFPAVTDGNAYGALVTLKTNGHVKVVAGPFAPAGLNCNTKSANDSNTVGSIGLGAALSSGTAVDTVASKHSSNAASIQSTSTVQGVSMLGGAITAQALNAVATSAAESS